MLGSELVAQLRESVLDDTVEPFLWSTSELLRFLNYAERQACRRAHLIVDSITATDYGTAATASTMGTKALCSLNVVAEQAAYNMSPKILQIRRCQLKSMTYPLTGPIEYPEADDTVSGWIGTSGTVGTAGSGGVPYAFLNQPNDTITFILAPSVADTAMLVVARLPLTSFTLHTQPEIPEQYHEGLLDWAAHLAYMKPDSDTLNTELATLYENRFTAQFGPLPDARSEKLRKTLLQRQRMRPRTFGS